MHSGGKSFGPCCARYVRNAGMAAVALMAVVGMAAPLGAAVDGSADTPAVPADARAIARTSDGQLQVVTGSKDVGALIEDQADGDAAAPDVLSIQADRPVQALGSAGENDPMRSQQWALDRTSFEAAWSVTRGQGVKVAI